MPCFFAISGYKNSGKTQLILKLFKELSSKGYNLGVIKSSHCKSPITDKQGSDTWQFKEAGVDRVGICNSYGCTFYMNSSRKDEVAFVSTLFSIFWDKDLVLCEGFKSLDLFPKLWLVKDEEEILKVKKEVKNLVGFVVKGSVEKWYEKFPKEKFFSLDSIKDIVSLLEERLKGSTKVFLKVNGRRVPLKPFVEEIIGLGVWGMISSLKGLPSHVRDIELYIKVNEFRNKLQ